MGVKPYLLKDSIVGIISQRLTRILCDKCKIPKEEIYVHNKIVKSYEKSKCLSCNNTGYKGRAMVSAVELIEGEYKKLVSNIYQEINTLSNIEMIDALLILLEKGLITIKDYKNFILEEGIDETLYKPNKKKAK